MPTPGEHKTVHPPSLKLRRTGARILAYAEEAGWTFVSREEAEERRAGFPTRRGWGHSGMLGLSEGKGGQECPPSVGTEGNRRLPRPSNPSIRRIRGQECPRSVMKFLMHDL